jgi:uracil-DNA glycosylase
VSSPLDTIAEEILGHRPCDSEPCMTCTNLVAGEGNPKAAIVLVGEAPGASEDREGRPFVGSAGKLLDKLLAEAGLEREDVFITNVLKARPPGNRNPRKAEVEHNRPWLDAQLDAIDPELIVLLGKHALDALAPGHKITQVHGKPLEHEGRRFFPVFHPAAALRTKPLREQLHADFAKLPVAARG